jgi:hypothetical protein
VSIDVSIMCAYTYMRFHGKGNLKPGFLAYDKSSLVEVTNVSKESVPPGKG